jgi:hypothetical protein
MKWHDVNDALPEPGTEVLAITKANGYQIVAYDETAAAAGSRSCWRRDEGKRWSFAHNDYVGRITLFEVTHWAKLPEAPEGTS